MLLGLYNKKRDFKKTPEPHGKRRLKKSKQLSFCVQKHDATRLHYDFRLELDGVLKSWAVTKGPSLNPADKRLAVRTEDHPLDYGDFEGTIPKGQYGGGTVMLWDRGTWTPLGDPQAGLAKGHMKFMLQGERMKGLWALVRMHTKERRENWLLIKEQDDKSRTNDGFLEDNAFSVKTGRPMEKIAGADDNKTSLLDEYSVQLATLVTEPPKGEDWIHEVKFDGYRILCFVTGKHVVIRTRNGHDWTDRFPAVAAALKKLNLKQAILDGEAVVLDKKGISRFQSLQNALSDGGDTAQIQAYFFDILRLENKDLRREPLLKRKETLKQLLKAARPPLYYSDHLEGSKDILAQACHRGMEGLVSKKKMSLHTEGRSKTWLKSKCNRRQEFIILGFTKSKSGPRAIGALQLGYMSEGAIAYAGKVGTGFNLKTAEELYKKLSVIAVDKPPIKGLSTAAKRGTTWVAPSLLCEASFTEWTQDGHVRHPSFEGLREDKEAPDVVHEKPERIKAAGATAIAGITITHPERILFEGSTITKLELAAYYATVAPYMMPLLKGRPISLMRCPSGAGAASACFFQRNPDPYMQKFVKAFPWKHHGKTHRYLYIEDEKSLVFLAQMGAIEIHAWGATAKRIDYPTRMVFDLDPGEGVPFEAVKLAAQDVRARLKRMKLESFLTCTGGKGLHIVVPLAGTQKWPDVKDFAARCAQRMAADVPEAYVATMTKAKRTGKIFVDYFRNDYTATAIADFSVRARPGAPVAVPLAWTELKKLSSAHDFSIHDVLKRLKRKKPDMARYTLKQELPL